MPLVDLSALTSLVAVVVAIAFLAGICYGIVAISAQVQLQEDIPAEVRGRVFGVLNMLISVASILPIIVVGQIADLVGTTAVILTVAAFVLVAGRRLDRRRAGRSAADEGRDLDPGDRARARSSIRPARTCRGPARSAWPRAPRGAPAPEPHEHGPDGDGGRGDADVSRVAVVFTGGTISMVATPGRAGRSRRSTARRFSPAPRASTRIAELVIVDLGRTPASHFTFAKLFEIAARFGAARRTRRSTASSSSRAPT